MMRPQQYLKNLFIFLPAFFALKIADPLVLQNACVGFVAFSLAASGIYILNDYVDIELDKKHPLKCKRPLASGEMSFTFAFELMVVLFFCASGLILSVSKDGAGALLAYVLLNVAYSLKLKHIAILDVTIISIGFILRLFVGSLTTGITLSVWIVVMTFLLALFIALAKRRDDVLIFLNTGKKMRKVIDGYNLQFLDGAMMIMGSVVIVSYILYTTSKDVTTKIHCDNLYLTALFVIVGILRYLQITFVEEDSGSPTKILVKDRFMQLTIIAWVASFVWILYL
jgi:4-hydroxybenzoate polyprenyltransferase